MYSLFDEKIEIWFRTVSVSIIAAMSTGIPKQPFFCMI
jgi:hypothetical protein